ncbi:MAG: protein translocase subunit SecDF [Flavobacteriales bacterium]|nr:protein translocase subunit SecDF [Flavobacteriales bacterium]MBL6868586.1 protein translocase subunit SecDF [Flavobacteriales bacterium]
MRNRSAIWVFTILLFLACLYQLSFSWVTKSFETDIHDLAEQKYDSLSNEAVEFVINGDTLVIGGDKEKQQIVSHYEQKLLAENRDQPTYPILDLDYQRCKDQELGLGLDLQGGMSVTLEVSIEDLVKNFAGNSSKISFKNPFNAALKDFKEGSTTVDSDNDDFIGLFYAHYKELYPKNPPMIFFSNGLKDYMDINSVEKTSANKNDQIIQTLRDLSEDAIQKTHRIIESRINKFGVSQPNIKKLAVSGRLQIELPGAKDKNRIRNLLQSTASLEFWDGAHADWTDEFLELNKAVSKESSNDFESDFIEISQDSLNSFSAIELESYMNDKKANDSLLEEKSLERVIKDSIMLADGKILNGSLWFIHTSNSPYIGVAKSVDTAKINSMLKSKVARDIFNLRRHKFLWSRDVSKYETSQSFTGHTLMAIEIPTSGEPKINGEDVVNASQSFDNDSKPSVALSFNSNVADVWAKWTEQKVGKVIAIVLDDQVFSSPFIRQKITGGNTEISGGFETIEEAQDLANILKAGSLPVPAVIVDEAIVGPSLGEENINSGLWSFFFAFLLVLFYMIFYYKRAGWVANVALIANVFFIIGTLASLGAALTLPGIAGLVLTIGMSVDANVLIYERIREELKNGKGIKLAIQDGYKHAYSAIIDANVTSLLTAVVLAYFGSGPIQGFATTLIIGVFTSLFSAIFITRLIFSYFLDTNKDVHFSRKFTENLFTGSTIEFLKKRKVFYVISALIVGFGIFSLSTKGLDGGVEFTGGRTYRVEFSEKIDKSAVQNAVSDRCVDDNGNNIAPEVKTVDNAYTLEITTKYLEKSVLKNKVKVAKIDASLAQAFQDLGYSNIEDVNEGMTYTLLTSRGVESQISDELIKGSFLAVIFSLFIIFIYIAYRFRKWQFGLGALIAMFHDVLVVLGLFSIFYNIVPFSMEIDQAFIAAILTVVGYSINDTVVVFDRIREYSVLHKKSSAVQVVDRALNSTLSRTINTSLSTFLVLLTIFIFGGESIKGFAFALMVGVVVGTYSSLFIATPLVVDLSKNKINA